MVKQYLVRSPKGYRRFKHLRTARVFAEKMERDYPKHGKVPVLVDGGPGSPAFVVAPESRTNPLFSFQSYYVKCDGKTFGPYKTKAKAKKVAVSVARVLEKPAKIYGKAKNPGRVMKAVRNRRDLSKGQFGRWIDQPKKKVATKVVSTRRATKRGVRRKR